MPPTTRRIVRRPPSRAPQQESEYEPDTDDVDEAPRSRRRNSAAAPARGRGTRAFSDGEAEPEDDSESREDIRNSAVLEGWEGHERNRAASGDFADEFKISNEAQLLKFLEREPFASYRQHWIEIPGKKSWPCIGSDCPLCDIGDSPQARTCFNVFDMFEGKNKILVLGVKAANQLAGLHKDPKTGPIDRDDLYYAINKSGKGQQQSYVITPVKERDVKDDWQYEPLTDDELDKFAAKCFTKKAIPVYTRAKLKEIAKAATGQGD